MIRHYVSIDGLEPGVLAFFGFQLAKEDDNFAYYVDGYGEDQIVDKKSPHIYVEDFNDAQHIKGRVIALRKKP